MDKIEYKGKFYTVTEELKLVPVPEDDGLDDIKVGSKLSSHGITYLVVRSQNKGRFGYSAVIINDYKPEYIGLFTECRDNNCSTWTRSLKDLVVELRNHHDGRKFKLIKE